MQDRHEKKTRRNRCVLRSAESQEAWSVALKQCGSDCHDRPKQVLTSSVSSHRSYIRSTLAMAEAKGRYRAIPPISIIASEPKIHPTRWLSEASLPTLTSSCPCTEQLVGPKLVPCIDQHPPPDKSVQWTCLCWRRTNSPFRASRMLYGSLISIHTCTKTITLLRSCCKRQPIVRLTR